MTAAATTDAASLTRAVVAALEPLAEPDNATAMAAYMKDRFPFLGIKAPDRRKTVKPVLPKPKDLDPDVAVDAAHLLWELPEREYQYVAVGLLRAVAGRLDADLDGHRHLIVTKSWWDTVDGLAAWVVGPVVARHDLAETMDEWATDANLWVARTAILHQLGYKERTDADRLFTYCADLAGHPDFFIRKAIGWALRQYAREDPSAVRAFVDAHPELSGLSKREARKHLDG